MTIKNVTIGSDAEVIVADRTGRPFPICGIVGGTKDKPRRLGNSPYYIQEDNVLLEFNIPPCKTQSEFQTHMTEALNKALAELPPSLQVHRSATAIFEKALIQFPQAYQFGCEPDFNAWLMEENPRPTAKNKELRSAAGHIHIGWDNPTNEDRIALVKACDIFAGLRSLHWFEDRARRELYGKAGSFRPKPYGIEHRVLDNEWVWRKKAKQVYDWYFDAINFVNHGLVATITEEEAAKIQAAINKYDDGLAHTLVRSYEKKLEKAGYYHAGMKGYE